MNKFPGNFFIGAATAAHQVEGNNTGSDCYAMEKMVHTTYAEPSGDAVDHYNRYAEDIKLLADAGLNAYRFSIEWARIEPRRGEFDDTAVVIPFTENGITTDDDNSRCNFIRTALEGVERCIQDGIHVAGNSFTT